jgi:hypothetical protein
MPSGQARITDFTRERREERVEGHGSDGSRQGGEPKVGIAVPSILIEDLARELGAPTTIIEDLVNWILGYLSKYWSVGFDRLVFDLAAARDEETQFSLEVLGIEVRERKITDYGIARLRSIVNTIIKYHEKAGLVEYVRDLGVVNLVKGGGGGDRPG